MKKKRRGWVRILIVLIVLAAIGGGAYWFYTQRGGGDESAAYVQSVAEITGMGSVGLYAQYNGIVEAKDVIEINPSGDLTVKECYVSTGSKVNEGDPLFRYDVDDLTISHAQILIDITGIENGLRTNREQLESLEKRLEKAKEKDRYEIELNIQTVELVDASEVTSPVSGTVRSVRDDTNSDPFGYSGGGSNAYITIIAGTDYCVKGTVNEQTVYTLYVGMPVLIRSRVSDTVYRGTIYRVDTDKTVSDQQMYYYDGGGDRASKYAFYVEPDSIEGLMIGQHVLIDLNADESPDGGLMLPGAFLIEENGGFFVWAKGANDRIEKRRVEVGAYDEATECYEILSGLSPKDRIAFPDETVHAGMLATETAFVDPDAQPGFDDGAMFPENGMPGAYEEPGYDPELLPGEDVVDFVDFGG